ncbi:zinc ribbon domain-containing protein [Caproiciproducens sp.]
MSMITCPECSKEISDRAEVCPNCGYPIKASLTEDIPNSTSNVSFKGWAAIATVLGCAASYFMGIVFQSEEVSSRIIKNPFAVAFMQDYRVINNVTYYYNYTAFAVGLMITIGVVVALLATGEKKNTK